MDAINDVILSKDENMESKPNPRKRKISGNENGDHKFDGDRIDGLPKGEYETGRVVCEVCGEGVSFRDESTGGFTLKHWDAHRQECNASPGQSPSEPVIYTPESTAEALANPPVKRRRAKRTEEERIEYLRSDPYVAEFEAYRVLCASCDKWIRLRPNSTYCSIPWDAHRKSCLSKKAPYQNTSGLDQRNAVLTSDPDVRKFDAERVLCGICDRWVNLASESNAESLQKWFQHRSACQKASGFLAPTSSSAPIPKKVPPLSQAQSHHQLALAASQGSAEASTSNHAPLSNSGRSDVDSMPESPSSMANILPSSNDTRRRSAEERADLLRNDPLLTEVEPNKVFCSLCRKWVQLRQDSSYCAYPWYQHKSKCVLRHQRIPQRVDPSKQGRASKVRETSTTQDNSPWSDGDVDQDAIPRDVTEQVPHRSSHASSSNSRMFHHDTTRKGKASSTSHSFGRGLADLDSHPGRANFVFASITYLFATTYESSDDMTISSLLTYLNAAMPPDKHEDFDTSEVIRAAAALQGKGEIIFVGDMIRMPP